MSAAAASPAAFDLSGLHAHIRSRLPVILAEDAAERQHQEALLRKRLPHVFAGEEPYQIRPATGSIASMIDHTVLKADATAANVKKVCAEAVQHRFASVCVNSGRVNQCVSYFRAHATAQSHAPRVCFVTGFPLGASTTITKVSEALECFDRFQADEVDMVINVGLLKDGEFEAVKRDVEGVVRASEGINEKRGTETIVKVILETCLLTNEEIIDATLLCVLAGANFVKTSTGFSTGGAVAHQVRLMKSIVGDALEVKASGGIRDAATAKIMVENGATRLGCSAGVAICGGGEAGSASVAAPGDGKY